MDKLDRQQELLLAISHDLRNLFFAAATTAELSAEYSSKLITLYKNLSPEAKAAIAISDKSVNYLERNLPNLRSEMELADCYLTSLNYNFCEYSNFDVKTLDINTVLDEARGQFLSLMQNMTIDTLKIIPTFSAQANSELLVNIFLRFLLLTKIYGALSVHHIADKNYHVLEIVFKETDILKPYLSALSNPTMNIPEMKIAFNLSLCYNYLHFLGGKLDVSYSAEQTHFKLYFPIA